MTSGSHLNRLDKYFGNYLFALYLLFLPPLLSLDSETDAAATQIDYCVDDPSFLPEQPGKPPLIPRYRLLFSLLLAVE